MAHDPMIAIIGAGPAGLMAAETLAQRGARVTVYDRMPSPLRKFLLAGRGGLNLTHGEPLDPFLSRYGNAGGHLESAVRAYPPDALREWAAALGEAPFVGSSGRVFPRSFKATPLARAWLQRLGRGGVAFRFRHRWTGWNAEGALTFEHPQGPLSVTADATLLALGGASWPRLGSDGTWQMILAAQGVAITPLEPSNAGIGIRWSETFAQRNAGAPLKGCAFRVGDQSARAEAVVTPYGLEGGAIYALSPAIRRALGEGAALMRIDLKPDVSIQQLAGRFAKLRKGESLSNALRKAAGLPPLALGLLREAGALTGRDPASLAQSIKDVGLAIADLGPIERAISTAGGVAFSQIDQHWMLQLLPGVHVAGEMLDWDAPTGGYLLQACFSSGVAPANGVADRLGLPRPAASAGIPA